MSLIQHTGQMAQVRKTILDPLLRGHTVQTGSFDIGDLVEPGTIEVSLYNDFGQQYLICGFSRCGENDVCGP